MSSARGVGGEAVFAEQGLQGVLAALEPLAQSCGLALDFRRVRLVLAVTHDSGDLELALAGAYHPEVSDDLVAVLGRDAEAGPEIVAALSALGLRTDDPQTRRAAHERLQLSSPT